MFWINPYKVEEAEKLAERLGTSIPSGIDLVLWALPILEAITDRIERIEQRLKELEEEAKTDEVERECRANI